MVGNWKIDEVIPDKREQGFANLLVLKTFDQGNSDLTLNLNEDKTFLLIMSGEILEKGTFHFYPNENILTIEEEKGQKTSLAVEKITDDKLKIQDENKLIFVLKKQ